ncbi:protein LPA2 isoform X2 [Diospyros lotus]|uniref:protein LPA2 isoform X2 n=1 Tax=Diospyros lotus TaxID=55363 RepID=UPI00224D2447|nr:protein LPA2 isoform X2 [Diospyros lotus]
MALLLHSISSSSFIAKKPHLLLLHASLLPFPSKPTSLSIKSQDSSAPQPDDGSSSIPKKPTSPGLGFGSASSSSSKSKPNPVSSKKKQKGKRERASITRRSPMEKPEFVAQQDEAQAKDQVRNENAFLLTWLGLGALILVEGIALAASVSGEENATDIFTKAVPVSKLKHCLDILKLIPSNWQQNQNSM